MSDVTLRPMRADNIAADDIVAVSAIEHAIPSGLSTRPLPPAEYAKELTTNPQAWFVLAEADGAVVGFAWLQLFYDEAHVMNIVTHPAWQGRGVGWQLMQALLTEARRRQAICLTLEVRAGNVPAQRLYAKCGLQVVGRRKRYYRDNGEDALIMTLGLG